MASPIGTARPRYEDAKPRASVQPYERVWTIDVPEVDDILQFGVPESEEARLAKWLRYQNRSTALPELFQSLPQIINYVDDAEDILGTALIAAKYLVPKLLVRFTPIVGWAVMADDVLNGITGVLAVPLSAGGMSRFGRAAKAEGLRGLIHSVGGRSASVQRGDEFMNARSSGLGFALQAGQVLDSFTGFGLQLGAVMGMVTDAFWATVRYGEADRVVVSLPPPDDLIGKAARLLLQLPFVNRLVQVVDYYDVAKCMIATNAAWQIIREERDRVPEGYWMSNQYDGDLQSFTPLFHPYWDDARGFVGKFGFSPLDSDFNPLTMSHEWPDVRRAFEIGADESELFESTLHQRFADEPTAPITRVVAEEVAQGFWDWFVGVPMGVRRSWAPLERMFALAIEYNVWPWYVVEAIQGFPLRCENFGWTGGIMPFCQAGYLFLDSTTADQWVPYPHFEVPNWDVSASLVASDFEFWLRYALDLYCGRRVPVPVWKYDGEKRHMRLFSWYNNDRRWGSAALALACAGVYGNWWGVVNLETQDRPAFGGGGFCRTPAGGGTWSGLPEGDRPRLPGQFGDPGQTLPPQVPGTSAPSPSPA